MMMEGRTAQSSTVKMMESRLEELSGRLGFFFSVVDMEEARQRFDKNSAELLAVLSEREWEYFDGLKLDKHRIQWLAGRYAVKAALLKYKIQQKSLMDFRCIDVLKGQDSAPYILQYPFMACSISHSAPYCVGVVSERKLGVDIEQVFHLEDSLVRFFYSSGEREALSVCGSREEYAVKAMTFWTRKEAVSKLLGLGMKMDFKELDTVQDKIYCSGSPEEVSLHSFVCNDFCVSLVMGNGNALLPKLNAIVGKEFC